MSSPVFASLGFKKPSGAFEAGGWDSLLSGGWMSDQQFELPPSISSRRIVYDDLTAPWGEHGPKWGVRCYNAVGEIRDLVLWRVGDWTKGREGHALYLNAAGDLLLSGCRGIQCGGQALQVVWRAAETRIPRALWPSAANLIEIRDQVAIQCGAINLGTAVRASWPVSVFATGARVLVKSLYVREELSAFIVNQRAYQSHGALLVTGGEEGRRTPSLVVEGLVGEIRRPDRTPIRLTAIDHAKVRGVSLKVDGGNTTLTIDVVDDCQTLRVEESTVPILVRIFSASDPYRKIRETREVPSGTGWLWSR